MSRKKITAILSPADREKAQPILDALAKRGLRLAGEKDGKAALLFLSEAFAKDEEAQERFFALDSAERTIIPVDLDGAAQSELVRSALIAKNAIAASGRTPEEIAGRVADALAFREGPDKRIWTRRILRIAVAALILGAAAWIWKTIPHGGGGETPGGGTEIVSPAYDFGLTQEDLAAIRDVVIVGDKLGFFTDADWKNYGGWPDWSHYAYLNEDNEVRWYSTEDGHEFGMQRYDDLRVIGMMPNLHYLTLICVETDALPDLSGAKYLESVTIESCGIDSLAWLAGSPMNTLSLRFTPVKDFGPLTDCARLTDLRIDMFGTAGQADFSAFAPPNLVNLSMWHANAGGTLDLSAMKVCTKLFSVHLGDLPVKDLSFLSDAAAVRELSINDLRQIESLAGIEKMPLKWLRIEHCDALRDISAVAEPPALATLEIRDCGSLRDFSPIGGCGALTEIGLCDLGALREASFLASAPGLKSITIEGTTLRDVDFLEGYPESRRLQLKLNCRVEDLSGLRHVKNYDILSFSPRSDTNRRGSMAQIYPYLEGATVRELELYDCTDLELSRLPTVTTDLTINRSDLDSLEDMPEWNLSKLRLDDLQYLTSLDGIEHLRAFTSGFRLALEIGDCPRLEDWSAIENTVINRMWLKGLYYLPRFETIGLNRLELIGIETEDLSFFDAMEEGRSITQLLLRNMEQLRDISALRRLKIDELSVPPQVADQAEDLRASGAVRSVEVLYPDGGWEQDQSEIALLSLDELDTLPKALLRRVRFLCVAGDRVADQDRYDTRDDWDHLLARDIPGTLLWDRESGEEIRVPNGKITDLKLFSDLTGLEQLDISSQPLGSLDGIQSLEGLKELRVSRCPKLTDVSAAFTMQELEQLSLSYTKISSIQGVQNLERLRELKIESCAVTDISPLEECDFSYAYEQGGLQLSVGGLRLEDLSPLSGIRSFAWLCVNGLDADLWLGEVENSEIRGLCAHYADMDQAQLESLLASHGELERLEMPYNRRVTDLTPLLDMENLRQVTVSGNMKDAVASLDGQDLPFELEIR